MRKNDDKNCCLKKKDFFLKLIFFGSYKSYLQKLLNKNQKQINENKTKKQRTVSKSESGQDQEEKLNCNISGLNNTALLFFYMTNMLIEFRI